VDCSIIIPTLNEAAALTGAVDAARAFPQSEILVVDGGSLDDTAEIAGRLGCRVLASPPGRARQMNAGAAEARGDLLLFLHADCLLPPNAADALQAVLADPRVGCGAFRHRIDSPRPVLRLIEAGDNFRAVWLRRPYGDQAIFVRRTLFEQIGGFPDVPLLEELFLIRRLTSATRYRVVDATVVTSARRWERHGIVRVTAINWLILLGAACGLPLSWLARLYYGPSRRPRAGG